jgi:hypothetical protein
MIMTGLYGFARLRSFARTLLEQAKSEASMPPITENLCFSNFNDITDP